VLTIFTTPKPFTGQAADHQRNAITSWTLLRPRPEVILLGDEEGTLSICNELGLRNLPEVNRNEYGRPLVSELFARAEEAASHDLVCYLNSDIVLLPDFAEAIRRLHVWRGARAFLAVGERWNVDVDGSIEFEGNWATELRERARVKAESGGAYALDYFVFTRGLFRSIPSFAVGRPGWDNWMLYSARKGRGAVVDVSRVVTAIHQRHGDPTPARDAFWSYP